ncbi:MAG: alpha/beta hydrolase [Nannocystaceae bacterium]
MRRAPLSPWFGFALCVALSGACKPSEAPTLAELQAIGDADKAGARLMDSPHGLLRLDADGGAKPAAVIAVHGFESRGKEWIDPLLALADNGVEVYFFHWNDKQCPDGGAKLLGEALRDLVARSPHLKKLSVVAHSYGGVITTLTAQQAALGIPVDVQIVASPLASVPKMKTLCDFDGVPAAAAAESITWHQWRTVHSEDGAFKDLEVDPQVIELPGLDVTQLPAEYEGGRLGHNRSITYVVREIDAKIGPAPAGP